MDTFIWDNKYSVGLEEIDAQHKEFFRIANSIVELANQGVSDKQVLLAEVMKLGDYAFYHLGTEEEYFEKYGYVDAIPHIAAHKLFREKANSYISQLRELTDGNAAELTKKIAQFAGLWLQQHILHADMKYSAFLKEKGVK